MAYRLRYVVFADWIGPGQGQLTSAQYPGQAGAGNAQTLQLQNALGGQNITGTGSGGAIAAADITTLTNAMAADILAQMNASPNLGRLQNFSTGQP